MNGDSFVGLRVRGVRWEGGEVGVGGCGEENSQDFSKETKGISH